MAKQALLKAVGLADGQTALTNKINSEIVAMTEEGFYRNDPPPKLIRQGHLWAWLEKTKGAVPPAEYVIPVERAVGVSRFELRPDVYGSSSKAA